MFGRYMQPVTPAGGEKVNWVNYKTGVPGISFRMEADTRHASIDIVLAHKDAETRREHYDKLLHMKSLLHEATQEDWLWQPELTDEYGKPYSSIGTTIHNVNIMQQEDWSALISFFKPRIIALDAFGDNAKLAFDVW